MTATQPHRTVESMSMLNGEIVGSSYVAYDKSGRQMWGVGSGGVGGTIRPATLTRTTYPDGHAVVTVTPPERRSIVRALTADFHDHSRPGCGCGERAGSSHSSAQAPATGDVAGAPKPTQQ